MMFWQDFINASFETAAGFFILLSILKLRKDKAVAGVHWLQVLFFAAWGWWNLYYYPSLGQWWSFAGGVGVVLTNTAWLGLMIYYMRRSKR